MVCLFVCAQSLFMSKISTVFRICKALYRVALPIAEWNGVVWNGTVYDGCRSKGSSFEMNS